MWSPTCACTTTRIEQKDIVDLPMHWMCSPNFMCWKIDSWTYVHGVCEKLEVTESQGICFNDWIGPLANLLAGCLVIEMRFLYSACSVSSCDVLRHLRALKRTSVRKKGFRRWTHPTLISQPPANLYSSENCPMSVIQVLKHKIN